MRAAARASAIVALLVGLAAPVGSESAAPPDAARGGGICGSAAATGQTSVSGLGDGRTHRYYWRVPATGAPTSGRPVLIWLHGDGGDGSGMVPGFWPHTDPDGAIVVTPDGTGQTWNHRVGDVPGTPYDSKFLSKVIDDVLACASVDRGRIFVGGTSRGAFMPYYLLQRSSTRDRIAAVAVNAGLLYCEDDDASCEAETSTPTRHSAAARILHLHGTNDTAVGPAPTARFHRPVDWSVDWRVFYPMKLWAQQNGCFDDAIGGANNGVLRETYPVAGRRARVYDLSGHGRTCRDYQLVLVDRGGHVIDDQEARIWAFLMDRPFVLARCEGAAATVIGTAGSDELVGTGGPDVIAGRGGNDTIRGAGGNDHICGGGGADRMLGGSGRDRLAAQDGTADRRIDCGAGPDPRAARDRVDPRPISCG
ncbi:hypothetical protein D0Z08_20525 [Nocardioides immobilis]|uniref:Polyhydroxybutyrate depolymerase n=1 Tax=Nocardioides immobilis TaxID=2049295 RepID=A0A417XY98_9ACTN|nr:hypothetical protein [Nocardioides immobilis]RHW25340.1 hypothetical protein D0Z08_20525 [Nocardioides immobilis]